MLIFLRACTRARHVCVSYNVQPAQVFFTITQGKQSAVPPINIQWMFNLSNVTKHLQLFSRMNGDIISHSTLLSCWMRALIWSYQLQSGTCTQTCFKPIWQFVFARLYISTWIFLLLLRYHGEDCRPVGGNTSFLLQAGSCVCRASHSSTAESVLTLLLEPTAALILDSILKRPL